MLLNKGIETQKWMQCEFLREVISILGDARMVGGCVRDALLNRTIKDIDLATSVHPDEVTTLLENRNIKVVHTGIKHGTVTAVKERKAIEITTLRRDLACDGRYAEVEYTDNWQEDAGRRDFTINALSMDLSGKVYDYFDGVKDLQKGIVRFVGDSELRVKEDYLRILRYFRFEANYGTHAIDQSSLKACIKYKYKVIELAGERIQSEMLKLLCAKNPYRILLLMKEEGVLSHIIPDISANLDLSPIRHIVSIEKEEGSVFPGKDAIIRLALLLEGGKKQVDRLCEQWKISNEHKRQLLDLVDPIIEIHSDMSDVEQKDALVKMTKDGFIRQLLYRWSLDEENKNILACKAMLALANTWDIPVFPLAGRDIIELGVNEGKIIGEILDYAYESWKASNYLMEKTELIAMVKDRHIQ